MAEFGMGPGSETGGTEFWRITNPARSDGAHYLCGRKRLRPARLAADVAPKQTANMQVELSMQPDATLAGCRTLLALRVKPAHGLEPYLGGAWAHMLALSDERPSRSCSLISYCATM